MIQYSPIPSIVCQMFPQLISMILFSFSINRLDNYQIIYPMFQHQGFLHTKDFVPNGLKIMQMIERCHKQALTREVSPQVEVGFLRRELPPVPPQGPCNIDQIVKDTEEILFPRTMQWQSPRFFAFFPSNICDMAMFGDLVATAFNTPGFNYFVSPAHTELQNLMADWTAIALGLPEKFMFKNSGGGMIGSTVSQSINVCIHVAKVRKYKELGLEAADPRKFKLAGYISETAHISGIRALALKEVQYRRQVPCYFDKTVKNFLVDIKKLEQIIQEDIANGLIPFYYGASVGTTFSGAADQIDQIAKICKKYKMWLNVDAAYLGATWINPDFRHNARGIEEADSIALNFSKPLFTGLSGSPLFIGDKEEFTRCLNLSESFDFYKNKYSDEVDVVDYKDWQTGLGRRNNSFKVFYIFKYYGIKKLAESIQSRYALAKYVEQLVIQSEYFEMFSSVVFGLVCFNLKVGGQQKTELTKKLGPLVSNIYEGFSTPSHFNEHEILRIVICNMTTTKQHIDAYWRKILEITKQFLANEKVDLELKVK